MRVPLQPPPGLVSDDSTFAAEGAWVDGSNVRFWEGRPQSIGAWESVFTDMLTGVCRNIKTWTINDGSRVMAFGTHSALQVYFAGTLSDITPAGLTTGTIDSSGDAPGYGTGAYGVGTYSNPESTYYPRTWSLDTWGENLVANPRGGKLYRWQNDPGVDAAEVANAPDEITCILVTPERQVLALGCTEEVSGDFNPLCIRGCDLGDIDDWTTSASNNAFEHILAGAGRIVKAKMVGNLVAVWTDMGLYVGQFLGNPSQTYRFDPVATNCGLIGPNAVEIIGTTAFWVGPDLQIRAWTPGVEPRIIECPIRSDFADNLDTIQGAKIVAAGVSRFGELWLHYPDARDGDENSRYIALSVDKGWWFRGTLARTAAIDAGVAQYPMAADYEGNVYFHETDGEVDWSITSADQYLESGERCLQLQRIYPDFKAQSGDVNLSVTMRMRPQAPTTTRGPFTIAAAADKKDFRATGAIAAVVFSGTGSVRFGKPTFDALVLGSR
jgi:hypothetical protein